METTKNKVLPFGKPVLEIQFKGSRRLLLQVAAARLEARGYKLTAVLENEKQPGEYRLYGTPRDLNGPK